jgi:hypothetical protein
VAACRVRGCEKEGVYAARGMCWGHYHRWHRYGHPNGRPDKRPWRERLLDRFARPEVGCWLYPTDSDRHPRIEREDGSRALARLVVWEELVGPINPAARLRRLCATRSCVRPEHHQVVLPKRRAA